MMGPLSAQEKPQTAAHTDVRALDAKAKDVKKTVVRHSMIGPRDTLIFYEFMEQKVVLVLQIGNANTDFPITATAYVFAPETTADGLHKWVNNRHSDGLFPDVPTPVGSHKLAAKSGKVLSHTKGKRVKHGPQAFDDYSVKFKMNAVEHKGVFKLKEFTDEANVFVKVQPAT